jgi:hypothetical protein
MPRGLSPDFINALTAEEVKPFYAAQLELDGGPIRLWTGYGDATINGNTFIGAGNLLGFSGFEEVNDLSAKAITITLDGLDETVLSLSLSTPIRNRKVRVYFGVIASDGTFHSVEIFTGRANRIPFEDNGETGTVQLEVDNKLVLLEKAPNWRYTHESHQARHPGDTFFSYVADLQDKELVWGRADD